MKISKLIENLKYLEETYGDLEVDILFETHSKIHRMENIHFAYVQFPDEDDVFTIQNFVSLL